MDDDIRKIFSAFGEIKTKHYDISIKNTSNVLIAFNVPNNISNLQMYFTKKGDLLFLGSVGHVKGRHLSKRMLVEHKHEIKEKLETILDAYNLSDWHLQQIRTNKLERIINGI